MPANLCGARLVFGGRRGGALACRNLPSTIGGCSGVRTPRRRRLQSRQHQSARRLPSLQTDWQPVVWLPCLSLSQCFRGPGSFIIHAGVRCVFWRIGISMYSGVSINCSFEPESQMDSLEENTIAQDNANALLFIVSRMCQGRAFPMFLTETTGFIPSNIARPENPLYLSSVGNLKYAA